MLILDEYHNGHPIKRVPLLVKNAGESGSAIFIQKMELINENPYLYALPVDAPQGLQEYFPMQMPMGVFGLPDYTDYNQTTFFWWAPYPITYPYAAEWIPLVNTPNYYSPMSYVLYKDTDDHMAFSVWFDPINTGTPQGDFHAHLYITWGVYADTGEPFDASNPPTDIAWNVTTVWFCGKYNASGFIEMDRTDWNDIGEVDRTGKYNIIDIKA